MTDKNNKPVILVTGFEPFGGDKTNPTEIAVKALPDNVDGAKVIKLVLPTVFTEARAALVGALKEYMPNAVLCLGVANSRTEITPERVAINIIDARIPDNTGAQPIDIPIFKDGPVGYWSTLPIRSMMENMKVAGLPTSISNTAGTYVCNNTMYTLRYYLEHEYPHTIGGFMHVPKAETIGQDKINKGVLISLETIAKALGQGKK